MRIAHVTATFPPYYGGTGNVCYHNARVLAARGHEVHVYTAAWPGKPDNPPRVRVHRLQPVMRVGNAPILPQLLALPDFDVVHLHYPFYSGAEFVALAGAPYVVTYHQDVELDGMLGWGTRLHGRTIGRLVLQRAARLCPTSVDYLRHSEIAELADELGDRVVELPNGVDTTQFTPGPIARDVRRRWDLPEDAFVLLFVARMDHAHYFKGLPTLFAALAQAPEVYALLVGDGDARPAYAETAARLGLAERIRFAGTVDPAELPAAYRAADALVLPSETRGEAFGMVLLEAMACGRPVIATDLPGVRGVITHGVDGLLVPPGDAAALAAAIRNLAELPEAERHVMGWAGRQKSEGHFDWETIGVRLEALYAEVIAERLAVGVR